MEDPPDTPDPNPLLQSAGLLQNDPFWDEMMESIRRHRQEMDKAWDETDEALDGRDPNV